MYLVLHRTVTIPTASYYSGNSLYILGISLSFFYASRTDNNNKCFFHISGQSLVFFYLGKLVFPGFLWFQGNFGHHQLTQDVLQSRVKDRWMIGALLIVFLVCSWEVSLVLFTLHLERLRFCLKKRRARTAVQLWYRLVWVQPSTPWKQEKGDN